MSSQAKHRRNRIMLWILIVIMAVWMLFPFYLDDQLLFQDGEPACDDACHGRSAQSDG